MDRNKLNTEVGNFIKRCAEMGKQVSAYCLNEAYPGDSSTSFFLQLKADWIKDDECFEAISFFTDIMFDVMSEEARRKIFSIQVFEKDDELHCDSGEITHVKKNAG